MRGVLVLALAAGCVPKQQHLEALAEIDRMTVTVAELRSDQEVARAALAQLEAQLADLEAENDTYREAIARVPSASTPSEAAAVELLERAYEAASQGDAGAATQALDELARAHPDSRAHQAAGRLRRELGVFGRDAGEIEVTSWIQGSASVADGEVTVLVFCEIWSPHCAHEMPMLEGTLQRYRSDGLRVVGVTKLTRSVEAPQVEAFLKEHRIGYPVAVDALGRTSDRFDVLGVPAAVAIAGGAVVWRGHPSRLRSDALERWLGLSGPAEPE